MEHATSIPRAVEVAWRWARRAAPFALLWWVLAEGRPGGWWLGGPAVVIATWASLRLSPVVPRAMRIVPFVRFMGYFLWNSLRGGAQVALMALRPRSGLAPALIDIDAPRLPTGAARVLLLNTLGLMPGTIGVGLDASRLRLHVIDARLPVAAEARVLEAHIARLYGVDP